MRIRGAAWPLAYVLRVIASRYSIKGLNRIIAAAFPPVHQTGSVESILVGGAKYEARLDSYIDWVAYFQGIYERELLEVLARSLVRLPSPVVLDVGANVGHHPIVVCEIGPLNRKEFPTLESFADYLPANYDYYSIVRTGRLFLSWRIVPMLKEHFAIFTGNLICYPRDAGYDLVEQVSRRRG